MALLNRDGVYECVCVYICLHNSSRAEFLVQLMDGLIELPLPAIAHYHL